MDLCEHLKHCVVYGAEISTIDRLPPSQPAVYAFFDLFRFRSERLVDDIDSFKTRHGREISVDKSGLPHFMHVRLRGNPKRFKGEGLKLCKQLGASDMSPLSSSLAFLSILNDALYVGKTKDIRDRFRAHHDKDFLYRMKTDHMRAAEEFLFFAYFCDERYVRVLESVLIQIVNPPFCDQKT